MKKTMGLLMALALVSAGCGDMNKVRTVDLGGGISMEFMPIEPGSFMMGSYNGRSNERPVHEVMLTQRFWMSRTEVTQAQWRQVMGSNPSKFKGDKLPVEMVRWNDAMAFCRRLTEIERQAGRLPEGYEYTLPTEAQWEYACRAGSTGDYATSTGSGHTDNLDAMAWYGESNDGQTHPVGTMQANAWGLYDMHGNVDEWCLDWYGDYLSGDAVDPHGASSGFARVSRGGSWYGHAVSCRSASRLFRDPTDRINILGFRVCLSDISSKQAAKSRRAAAEEARRAAEEASRVAEEYENARVEQSSNMDSMGIKTNNFVTPVMIEFIRED